MSFAGFNLNKQVGKLIRAALFMLPLTAAAANYERLGDLPGGTFESYGFGISADGRAVTGASKSTASASVATAYEMFLWTENSGLAALGDIPGGIFNSEAYDISDDGNVIAGLGRWGSVPGQIEAIRWTASTGIVRLGALEINGGSQATAISADGSVVVGGSTSASGTQAFRWNSSDGMVGIGDLTGSGFYSFARGVSADGSIVVGSGQGPSGYEAFVWTAANGMSGLGDLPGGGFYSAAYGVSDDGSVIVGGSRSASSSPKNEAFRWTATSGMVGLGDLPGGSSESYALAVSDDGDVVVGFAYSARGQEGILWTEATGLVSLTQYLEDKGVTFGNFYLGSAYDVSPDGRFISGSMEVEGGDIEAYSVDLLLLEVKVNFDPWNSANEIHPDDSYLATIAIETTSAAEGDNLDFDALQADPSSLRIGPNGTPNTASPLIFDMDSDGDADVTFGFRVENAGIACDDSSVELRGQTYAGEDFVGTDSITTLDCTTSSCHP